MLGTAAPTRDIPIGVEHDERGIRDCVDEKLGSLIVNAGPIGFGTRL
jgi:hypothetical protein